MRWLFFDSVLTGWRWLLGGRKPAPFGFSYARNASAKVLIFALPFFLVPDQVIWMVFVPAQYFYLRPLFILFDVYMMLIVAGIIVSLDECPHTIDGDCVTLRQGRIKWVTFEREDVLGTSAYGTQMGRAEIRAIAQPGAAYLLTSGAATLCVRLRHPVQVHTVFGSKTDASVLYVSVDDPRALQTALTNDAPVVREAASSDC